jgi:hypothetical protein
MVAQAPGDARTVVNVGAGAGSYEPVDRTVLAVEPSSTMVAQRPVGAAPSSGRRQSPCRCPTDVPRRPWPCSPSTTGATRPPVSPSSSPSRGASADVGPPAAHLVVLADQRPPARDRGERNAGLRETVVAELRRCHERPTGGARTCTGCGCAPGRVRARSAPLWTLSIRPCSGCATISRAGRGRPGTPTCSISLSLISAIASSSLRPRRTS